MTLLNVVDVEATCWAGEPPAGQVSEIIECAAKDVPYPFGPVHERGSWPLTSSGPLPVDNSRPSV